MTLSVLFGVKKGHSLGLIPTFGDGDNMGMMALKGKVS